MNLTNRLDARLEPEEYEKFVEGHPIQIPTGNRLIVLYPPAETDESQHGESETQQDTDSQLPEIDLEQ